MKLTDLITNRLAKSDPLTKAIIKHYNDCELTVEEVYDDEKPRWYQLPDDSGSLMVCGDDSWGSVTGIVGINGHLVLIGCFGDEGYYLFSPTLNRKEYTNPLNDEKEWINTLDKSNVVSTHPLLG